MESAEELHDDRTQALASQLMIEGQYTVVGQLADSSSLTMLTKCLSISTSDEIEDCCVVLAEG